MKGLVMKKKRNANQEYLESFLAQLEEFYGDTSISLEESLKRQETILNAVLHNIENLKHDIKRANEFGKS